MSDLINTSVQDARSSLACTIARSPEAAAHDALAALMVLRGQDGHSSRRKMLASVIRQAARAIANTDERDPRGPAANDVYANLAIEDMRKLIERRVAVAPADLAYKLLDTLISLRGEISYATSRRRALVAGIGNAAKALEADHG